jgi:hypothetical protein
LRRSDALIGIALLAVLAGCRSELPSPGPPPAPALSLRPADPNPFATSTRIPFELGDSLFGAGDGVKVSMTVYNLLYQRVAVAVAGEGFATGQPIAELTYPAPGLYEGVWDGTLADGRPAAPGPYFVQVTSGDHKAVGKLFVSR